MSRIVAFDNHDQAYHEWKRAGIRDAAIVHVDAHHDMFDPHGSRSPVISDYMRWAIREDIAREVFWAVPEPAWESEAGQEIILGHLKGLADTRGGGRYSFHPEQRRGRVFLSMCPVNVCSFDSLPRVEMPLVLDIDTDYLLIKDVPFASFHRVPERPWIWPDELVEKLGELRVRAEMVTVCYSVSGGYTPLMWKHLGDDLVRILSADDMEDAAAYVKLKARMAEAMLEGDLVRQSELLEIALQKDPEDASLYHWRALAYLQSEDVDQARQAHARAVEIDAAYAGSAGFSGLIHEVHGDIDAAMSAYGSAVELDEEDALGWYGLGRIAIRKRDLYHAKQFLTRAASLPHAPAEAHRELGALAESMGEKTEALSQYRSYLRRAFAGRSLESPIAYEPDRRFRCPFWAEGYAALARLYSGNGDSTLTANCYAEAMKLTNTRVHNAARPLLRKMAGAKNVPASQIAASCLKLFGVGLALGATYVYRTIRRKVRSLGKGAVFASYASGRLCPPVKVGRPSHVSR